MQYIWVHCCSLHSPLTTLWQSINLCLQNWAPYYIWYIYLICWHYAGITLQPRNFLVDTGYILLHHYEIFYQFDNYSVIYSRSLFPAFKTSCYEICEFNVTASSVTVVHLSRIDILYSGYLWWHWHVDVACHIHTCIHGCSVLHKCVCYGMDTDVIIYGCYG